MEYKDVLGDILRSYTHQMSNIMAVGPWCTGLLSQYASSLTAETARLALFWPFFCLSLSGVFCYGGTPGCEAFFVGALAPKHLVNIRSDVCETNGNKSQKKSYRASAPAYQN